MSDRTSVSPGMAWALGGVFCAVGLVPILQVLGYLPVADGSHWLMVCVGAMFIAGGLAIVVQYGVQQRGPLLALLQYVLVLIVTGMMTVAAAWVAFAPGERRFRTNVPFLPPVAAEWLGRIAFGITTMVMVGVFALFAIVGAQQLSKKHD